MSKGRRWERPVRHVQSAVVLLLASALTPARVYAANLDKFPHPERLLVVIAGYLAVGLLWYWVLVIVGIGAKASTGSALALVIFLSSSGPLAMATSTPVAFAMACAFSITLASLLNQRGEDLSHAVVSGATMTLVVMLGVVWLQGRGGEIASSQIAAPTRTLEVEFRSRPDIFLVVLDGFPGERAISEVYERRIDFGESPGVMRNQMWAAYPTTIASLSSMLNMNYPLGDGSILDTGTSGDLARIMSGENQFVSLVREEGYHLTVVESGYSRSFCSDDVDECVASAFLDEGVFGVMSESIVGVFLTETRGSAFTVGGLRTMSWLKENLPRLAIDDKPDFVFASVLAPHPPLFLDENCDFAYQFLRSGNSVFGGDALVQERQRWFVTQARCVASFENQIFESVPDDALLIFVSDHGGDSLGQMAYENHVWNRTEIIERLNVHLAIRTPKDCSLEPAVMLPDVLRWVSFCLADDGEQVTPQPPRMFTASRIPGKVEYVFHEVPQKAVSELLSGSSAG